MTAAVLLDRWHGTSGGYTNHKCRCAECREAFRVAAAKRKAERYLETKDESDPRHGLASFYGNHGCRCIDCRAAWARDTAARHRRRKQSTEAKES